MEYPIYEVFIKEEEDVIGVALVDTPAIETNFMYFNEEVKMVFNDEKMIVRGPALIPNKLMYKALPTERYVFYSEDTIYKFVELLMNKKENKFNLLHTDNYINANVIESYFATEPNEFGVPKGSWIVSAKIKDQEVWTKIKSGELKGFSIQGLFGSELVEFAESFNKKTKGNMNELKEKIFSAINLILFDEKQELPEEVVKEEFKEEVVNQEVIENVIEEKVEAPVVDEQIKEFLELETFKSLMSEMKTSIMEEMSGMIAKVNTDVANVKVAVEEFSKQPISESITEQVANPKIDKSTKAAKFFVK